jgi:hypothetical protein
MKKQVASSPEYDRVEAINVMALMAIRQAPEIATLIEKIAKWAIAEKFSVHQFELKLLLIPRPPDRTFQPMKPIRPNTAEELRVAAENMKRTLLLSYRNTPGPANEKANQPQQRIGLQEILTEAAIECGYELPNMTISERLNAIFSKTLRKPGV